MRFAALGLLLSFMVASTAQANWMGVGGPQGPFNVSGFANTFSYSVSISSSAGGTVSGAPNSVPDGHYAYWFELGHNSTSTAPLITEFSVEAYGITDISSFVNSYHGSGGTIAPDSTSTTGGRATFYFDSGLSGTSQVLYFVSTYAPSAGTAYFNGTGGANAQLNSAAAVPVPPALALVLAGAPFAEFIRRRRRSS